MLNLTRAKRISGWMSDSELEFLASAASKSKVIIEIGSYFGRSCMVLADNTSGIVYSVDPYKGEYETHNPTIYLDLNDTVYKDFMYNLSEHILSGKVVQFRGLFRDFPPVAADFIFIDGDHSYKSCLEDIDVSKTMIRHGGIIAGHDYGIGFPGVEQSVKESFDKVNITDSIWWARV